MAWSDAARKAALEARRAHMKAKQIKLTPAQAGEITYAMDNYGSFTGPNADYPGEKIRTTYASVKVKRVPVAKGKASRGRY